MANDDSDTTKHEERNEQESNMNIARRQLMKVLGVSTAGLSGLSGLAGAQSDDPIIELKAVTADIGDGQSTSESVWENGDLSNTEAVASQDDLNNQISLQEIQQAIHWWQTESVIPNTAGETLNQEEVQQLINVWSNDTVVDNNNLTNPALSLTAGDDYTVEWVNTDGQTHNFVIIDSDGNELVASDTLAEQGATQTVAFTATDEMAEYYCTHHTDSQRGTIEIGAQSADFSVSSLEPTSLSVAPGDSISVSATIANTGDGSDTQEIAFRIGDEQISTQSVTLDPDSETIVSFEDIAIDSFDAGEYTYGVYSDQDSQTGTLTLAADGPPNVIVIMADDMGYGDTSVPPFTSDETIPTPNLEEMASNGATFTSHYCAAPVCTPSRAALLTGCYPPRVGMDNHVYFPGATNGLHPDETLIPEVVQQQDYATGMIGKWHLGDADPFLPLNQGFDTYFGVPYSNDMNPFPLIEGMETVQEEAPNDQLTQLYTEQVTQFIEAHQDEPFFLYLPHTMPHVPLGVSNQFDGVTGQGTYADVIRELDWSVGQILNSIAEMGIEEDTLVIFTTDDGPWLSKGDDAGSSGPLRGGKMSTWEGGARVPTIVQMPGTVPAETTCNEMTSHVDLLPTIANLAGADLPDVAIDGKDITDVLKNPETASSPHEYLMYYDSDGSLDAIRNAAGWKYHFTGGQLYDLEADIGESNDVSTENSNIVDQLQEYGNDYDSALKANAREEGSLSNIAFLSIGSSTNQGETTTVTFTNNRDVTVMNVNLTVSSPDDGVSIDSQSSMSFDSVESGSTASIEIQLTQSSESTVSHPFVHAEATYQIDGQERATHAGERVAFSDLDPVPDQYSTFNNGSDNPIFGSKDGSLIIEGTGGVYEANDAYSSIYLDDGLPSTGTVVTKVTSVDQATEFSTGDLIVRNDITQPGESPGYAIISVNEGTAEIKIDANGDGNIQASELHEFDGSGLPRWLRVQRNGTTFVASHSPDGSNWTEIATFELAEASDVQDVGMAVTSSTAENARAEFGEFEVTTNDIGPLPEKYSTFNNGSDAPVFGARDGSLIIEGTGAVTDSEDAYSSIYLDDGLPSTGTVVTKVTSVDQATEFSTGDLIVRNDITQPGESPGYAIISVNEDTAEIKIDESGDGLIQLNTSEYQGFSGSGLPRWLRIQRDGTTFVASHSSDGSSWTEITSFELEEASEVQDVGMAVTSSTAENARAEFGEFEVSTPSDIGPLPEKYSTFNNGSENPSYGASDGTLFIEGTGKSAEDIDEYTAVYLADTLSDSATAVAKISSVELVSQFSSAGFIVRNDIAQPGTSLGYAQTSVNQNSGEVKFDENANGYLDDGVNNFSVNGLPTWLKLERNGTSYTVLYSSDGSTWTEALSFELENANLVQDIGIAVTAPVDENTSVEIEEFEVINH